MCGFIESKNDFVKRPPKRPQAGRKSTGEEDGAERRQQFQIGVFTPFSARRCQWYRKAAIQGNATAQNLFAICYDKGKGVPQDYAEAVKWFRKAAQQRQVEAQFNLGLSYARGEGAPQDYAEAIKWCGIAAEQGDPGRGNSAWHLL